MNQTASSANASAAPSGAAAWLDLLAEPWRQLHRWPPFSWLVPHHEVRLLQADGDQSFWLAGQRLPRDAVVATPFVAVELPESMLLRRKLRLPPLAEADVREAVALDVRSASPFDLLDLVWAHAVHPAADGQLDVSVVLASRRLIAQHVQGLATQIPANVTPEVWVREGAGAIVLPGFGEGARQNQSSRGRWVAYLLLALAALLALAVVVTPTIQLQLRAAQADFAYREAERRTGPLVGQREALTKVNADLEALREQMAEHVDPLTVVDLLTQLVPDDTWLQRLQVQGSRVTLSGQTPNSAALMDTLGRHPAVRDVKAPSAATRAMGGSKENFTIEFVLAPDAMRSGGNASVPSLLPTVTPSASVTATVTATTTVTTSTTTASTSTATTTPTGTATATVQAAPVPASASASASAAASAPASAASRPSTAGGAK